MKNQRLCLFFLLFQLSAFAQLEDYLPTTPASLQLSHRNYKQYIISHRIKTVMKWRVDSITNQRLLEKITCFTPGGDTSLCYDYTNAACYKRVINRDTHGKITEEDRYTVQDTVNPIDRIKFIYAAGRVSETRHLILHGIQTQKRETYLYDKGGLFLRVERFDSITRWLHENETYRYNTGNLVFIKYGIRDSVSDPAKIKIHVASSVFFEYDEAKRLKSIKYYTGDKTKLVRTELFQYDEIGNLIHYTGSAAHPDWTADMKYDDKRSIITYELKDASGKLRRSVASSYGKSESLAQEIETLSSEGTAIPLKNIYKYKYLKDDNISVCDQYSGTKHKGKITYEYEYYPGPK